MNKLAILAFSLLVFFSTMLWYLANGSLNDYLKSQIQLQGQYYTQQQTQLSLADYSSNEGRGVFSGITLSNPEGYQEKYALIIDKVNIELSQVRDPSLTKAPSPFQTSSSTDNKVVVKTKLNRLTINKLTINFEKKNVDSFKSQSNISELLKLVKIQLALDYPQDYPEISAKWYAQKNPELNAEAYAELNPQAGPIIEHTKKPKKRGKPQNFIGIDAITINTLELNSFSDGVTQHTTVNNITLPSLGVERKIVSNQIGGELLVSLLNLHKQN